MMVSNTKAPPGPKYPTDSWRWKYDERNTRWTTYRHPGDWPAELYDWLYDTFGMPGRIPGNWGYHSGWLFIYKEELLTLFKLRWS